MFTQPFIQMQGKHQSSASLAFVRGIHRRPVNSPHKWPVTRKMFPFDDVTMHAIKIPIGVCAWLRAYVMRVCMRMYVCDKIMLEQQDVSSQRKETSCRRGFRRKSENRCLYLSRPWKVMLGFQFLCQFLYC